MTLEVCKEVAFFSEKTALKLKTITDKNFKEKYKLKFERFVDEISGKLKLRKKNGIYELYLGKISKGNGSETDFINSEYTFHTHPTEAYIEYNCELGWPSSDDYMAFVDGFLNFTCIFHCVVTLEGIYIINIDPESVIKLCKFYHESKKGKRKEIITELEQYNRKYLNVDKTNFKKATGVSSRWGRRIHSVNDYVSYVNKDIPKFKLGGSKEGFLRLYSLRFISWKELLKDGNFVVFEFYFKPTKKGICKIRK
jgi:hypothetical protein